MLKAVENSLEQFPCISVNARQLEMHRAGWKVWPAMNDMDSQEHPYLLFVALTDKRDIFDVCRVHAKSFGEAINHFKLFQTEKAKLASYKNQPLVLGKVFLTLHENSGMFLFNDDPYGFYQAIEMKPTEDTFTTVNVTFKGGQFARNAQLVTPEFTLKVFGKLQKDPENLENKKILIPGVESTEVTSAELELFLIEKSLLDIQKDLTLLVGEIPKLTVKQAELVEPIAIKIQTLINTSLKLKNTLESVYKQT